MLSLKQHSLKTFYICFLKGNAIRNKNIWFLNSKIRQHLTYFTSLIMDTKFSPFVLNKGTLSTKLHPTQIYTNIGVFCLFMSKSSMKFCWAICCFVIPLKKCSYEEKTYEINKTINHSCWFFNCAIKKLCIAP